MMRRQNVSMTFRNALLIGVGALAANSTQAATVNAGVDPEAQLRAGVRYRHMNGMGMGNPRVHLGTYPLPTSGLANATSISWGSGKHVTFTYQAGQLKTVVGTAGVSPASVTLTRTVGSLGTLNYLHLDVQAYHPMVHATSVEFRNVTLNGKSLSQNAFTGTASGAKWNVTGEDLTGGFTLEGDIVLSGMQPGADNNHVDILVGYAEDKSGPDVQNIRVDPNPAILNGSTTLRATVSDKGRGGNIVTRGDYSLNGGTWAAMSAQDGAFDTDSEDVEGQLPATQLGENTACVRGTDSKGNVTAPPTCTTFLVTYKFEGFREPVDNDVTNMANAAQAVPVKWRLTDADGVAIDDASSFVALQSYPLDCTDMDTEAKDAVEEYAPGNSGLKYQGNGDWQYNWKTPKNYAGTCRALYIEFDSGAFSPIVKFRFR